MTHRSRSGGPIKPRPKAPKSKDGPKKLHHPPSSNTPLSIEPNPLLIPFLTSPTDPEILNLIHHALKETLLSHTFLPSIQRIKALLFDRKWLEVFEDPAFLEAYAGRWVPSRACCFRSLIGGSEAIMKELFDVRDVEEDEDDSDEEEESEDGNVAGSSRNVLALGGGAGSELLALASLVASPNGKGKSKQYTYTSLDIGAWSGVLDKLHSSIKSELRLPDSSLSIHYTQTNLLSDTEILITTLKDKSPNLVTLLFTLSELLQQSRQSTITLLHNLTTNTSPGTLFLIADSASDISEFEMGSSGRKWPVYMLLDTILSGMGGWKRVEGEDSRWFRFEEGVGAGWVVKLENTRYWYRVYKRV
jgi:25S rRNA (uracil2843-N3)-methyltransferase